MTTPRSLARTHAIHSRCTESCPPLRSLLARWTLLLAGVVIPSIAHAQASVTISPVSGTRSSQTLTYTVDVCYPTGSGRNLNGATYTMRNNGVVLPPTGPSPVSDPNCSDKRRLSSSYQLVSGTNTFDVTVTDGGVITGSGSATYTWGGPPPPATPQVTAPSQPITLDENASVTPVFTVTNNGMATGDLSFTISCPTALNSCTPSPVSPLASVQVGEVRVVNVTINGKAGGGAGTLSFTATGPTGVTSTGSVGITVRTANLTLAPVGGTITYPGGTTSSQQAFTLTNTSTSSQTISLSSSCTLVCTVTSPANPVSLTGGQSVPVNIQMSPSTTDGPGTINVTATVQGTSLSRSASQSYAVSQQPIQVTLAPVSNANVTNPLLSYTVDVCLPGAQSGYSFTLKNNGTSVGPPAPTVTTSGNPYCITNLHYVGNYSLVMGANTLVATAINNGASGTGQQSYTLYQAVPQITNQPALGPITPDYNGNATFRVTNIGNIAGTFNLWVVCGGKLDACSSPKPTTVTLQPNLSTSYDDIVVNWHSQFAGGAASIQFTATATDPSARTSTLTLSPTVAAPISNLTINPLNNGQPFDAPVGVAQNQVMLELFNNGGNYTEKVTLTSSCTMANGEVPTCTVVDAQPVSLPANARYGVTINLRPGPSSGVVGQVSLTGKIQQDPVPNFIGMAAFKTSVNTNLTRVTFQSGGDTVLIAPERDSIFIFTVVNTGSTAQTYNLTTTCNNTLLASCSPMASLALAASTGRVDTLRVTAATILGQVGTLYLKAAAQSSNAITDSVKLAFRIRPRYAVMPRRSTLQVKPSADTTVWFSIQNQRKTATAYTVNLQCTGQITCVGPATITTGSIVPEDSTAKYGVQLKASATTGSGKLLVIASGISSGSADTAQFDFTVTTSTMPPRANTAPFITLAPEQRDWQYRNNALCAMNCFDDVRSVAIPAYISMDTPRSAGLNFRRSVTGINPLLFEFDVVDSSSVGADYYWAQMTRSDGTKIPFRVSPSVTSDTLFFKRGGSPQFRIALNPATAGTPTGVYDATITMGGVWAGQGVQTRQFPLRYTIRDEKNNVYGTGWMLSGLQTVKLVTGGKLILDDDGGWSYFANKVCLASCNQSGPPGDFTVLRDSIVSNAGTLTTVGYTRYYPDSSSVWFNSTGLMLSVTDRYGNVTQYDRYSGNLRVQAIIDPAGKSIYLHHASSTATSPVAMQGWVGPMLNFNHATGNNDLTSVSITGWGQLTLPTPSSTTYTDPLGKSWTYAHDAATGLGKLTSITAPAVFVQGANAQPKTTFVTRESQLLAYIGSANSGAGSATATIGLQADTIRARVIDPKGYVTYLRLNQFGAATEITAPNGAVTTTYQDSFGHATTVVNPRGNMFTFGWSGPYQTRVFNQGSGDDIVTRYDTTSGVVRIKTTRNGVVTGTTTLGVKGPITSVRVGPDTSSLLTQYAYYANNRLKTITDPKSHVTTYTYLSTGFQNIDVIQEQGRPGMKFYYDTLGRVNASQDPHNLRDTTVYDLLNRVTYHGTYGSSIKSTYDALRLRTVTDAKSQVTQYDYNDLGWLLTEYDPNARFQSYDYDKNGNVVAYKNRRGQIVNYTYDNLNGLASVTQGNNLDATYYSDPQGRYFVAANAAASTDTIKFNIASRPDTIVTVQPGLAPYSYARVYRQAATYDKEGRRLTHNLTYSVVGTPPAGAMTYWANNTSEAWQFDEKGQLRQLTDAAGQPTSLSYDAEGTPQQITMPNLTEGLGSSGVHLPSAMMYNRGQGALSREYGYYASTGLLADRIKYPATTNGTGTRFSYDTLGQLLTTQPYTVPDPTDQCGKVDPNTGVQNGPCPFTYSPIDNTFSYDAVGNRTDQSAVIQTGNRLTTFAGMRLRYDLDGNLTEKKLTNGTFKRYVWSADNRLLQELDYATDSVTNTASVSFLYDALGRRVRKYSSIGQWRYIYDGDNLLAQLTDAGEVKARYTNYPDVDKPHSVMTSLAAGPYQLTTEMLGSVSGLVDKNGAMIASWDYDSWGVPRTLTGGDTVPMSLRFAARDFDPETGLYLNRARYYDPQLGRFISEDPIGLAGGINAYVYAGNSPTNAVDPSGRECYGWRLKTEYVDSKLTFYSDWGIIPCPPDPWGQSGIGGIFDSPWGDPTIDHLISVSTAAVARTKAKIAEALRAAEVLAKGIYGPGDTADMGMCKADLRQLGVSVALDRLHIGIKDGLQDLFKLIKNPAAWADKHVANGVIKNAALTPGVLAVVHSDESGTPNPFDGAYGTAYEWSKEIPGVGPGLDGGEAILSCTGQVDWR